MATVTLHLNWKNSLSVIAGICVIGLAIIPLVIPIDHLSWLRWRIAIVLLMLVAIGALFVQALIQSREDDESAERDAKIVAALEKHAPTNPLPPRLAPSPVSASGGFYVELHSTFVYPKVGDLTFSLLEAKYAAMGKKPEEATTDCDLLVELYIVNRSGSSLYIKDFAAWMELAGEWRKLSLDENFELDDLWSGSVEYGLETHTRTGKFPDEPAELPRLIAKKNVEIRPQEPIDGWLKFSVPNINPKRQYSIQIAVIDSVGREHRVDVSDLKKREIGLRRVRS